MAEIDVIGGIFSKEAEKSLDNVIAKTEKAVKAIQNLNSLSSGAGNSGGGGGGSKGGSKAEFDAATQAVNELVKARQKLTTAEQYDYAEVVRVRLERKKLTEQLKEQALALEGNSKAQKKAAKDAEIAAKQYQKAIEAQTKAFEKQQREQQKAAASTPQAVVDKSANTEKLKLAAIAASQYTTQLQKLDAQIRLLSIDMDSKFNPELQQQSQEYRELYAQQSRLKESYQRLSRATGQMGSSSKSAYGSFFQMTQVMRELPNFAIDARIGFMALSNNLPMLADEFKAVKQQIIDTEGAAGASIKTWKSLAKSLLSLNTIMIVASTLLVLFGDDIIEWAGKLFEGEKAVDRTTESIKALIEVTRDYDGQAASTITNVSKLGIEINKFGGDAKVAKIIVDEFNTTFGTHLETIDEVKAAYPEMAKVFIDNAMKMQAAMALIGDSTTAFLKKHEAEMELAPYSKKQIDEQKKNYDELMSYLKSKGKDMNKVSSDLEAGKTPFDSFLGQNVTEGAGKIDEKIALYYENKENLWFAKRLAIIYKQQKVLELKKKEAELILPAPTSKKTTSGGSSNVQDGTDMLVDKESYSKERQMLVAKSAVQEREMQEKTTTGIIQSFKIREEAAFAYQQTILKIAMIDNEIAKKEIADKLENDLTQIKSTQDNNLKLEKEGKITAERIAELKAQFIIAEKTLIDNANIKQLERQDSFNKKAIELEIQTQTAILAIKQQSFEMQSSIVDRTTERESTSADVAGSKKASSIKNKGFTDVIQKITGGSKTGESLAILENERNTELEKSIIRQNGIKLKLAQVQKGSEEERKLRLDLDAEIKADAAKGAEYEIKKKEELENMKYDLQVQATEKTFETMKALSEAFFAWQEELIDKQLDRDTKINDERLAQYEDETKAGKHTAKELDDRKKQSADYQTSLDEEAARKKAELEKQQFLLGQAMALGQVWINYAMAQPLILAAAAAAGIPTFGAGTAPYLSTMEALSLAAAIASSAAIAAQTIPAFAEGGDMLKDGKAILGDGGKHELVVDPRGNFFISDNKSGLYDLKAGSHIFPDVNRLDIEKVLGLNRNSASSSEQKLNELATLKSIERAIKTQKQGNFYGMPLVRQMNNSERYGSRKRGLMN